MHLVFLSGYLLLSSTDWKSCFLHDKLCVSLEATAKNTRAYMLSTQQCPARKFRYFSVLLIQISSAFQFCRQVQSSEFSIIFMKVNDEVYLLLKNFYLKISILFY